MRTALSVAALAAGALAVPYKRDTVYTDYDIVYVTAVVTVTAGQAPAAYTSASSESAPVAAHYGHHNGWHSSSSAWTTSWETTTTEVIEPTTTSTSTSVPAYTPPPSSTSTPEPETTSTSSTPVVYVAPPTTSSVEIPLTTYVPVASSTSAAPASSSASSAGSYGSADATYAKSVIDSHNLHRANHSASDLVWDDDLYTIAMEIGATCNYAHNTEMGGGGYGQNIAAGVDSDSIMSVITDMFYNGEEWQYAAAGNYDNSDTDMSSFEDWGHFTQVVWAATTSVACYTTTTDICPTIYSVNSDGSRGDALASDIPPYFTVCNYKNPGNYAGEYYTNVGKPKGEPTVYAADESD